MTTTRPHGKPADRDHAESEGRSAGELRDALKAASLALYHGVAEPLRALRLKRTRLALCGFDPDAPLPTILVDPYRSDACAPTCGLDEWAAAREAVVARYVDRGGDQSGAPARLGRARVTPMAIELARYPDLPAFEAALRRRSSRTLPKARAAFRKGYAIRPFPMRRHVEDIHAIKTSMMVRTGGPVLDYWLLRPEHVGRQARNPVRMRRLACDRHWTIWWGAFEPAPGHEQGGVVLDERLVGFIKAVAIGDLVHYADIMGHRDHLDAGVMIAIHLAIIRWLIESGEPAAGGVKAALYGAAEHGREGLLTWKRRAGFEPARLALSPSAVTNF